MDLEKEIKDSERLTVGINDLLNRIDETMGKVAPKTTASMKLEILKTINGMIERNTNPVHALKDDGSTWCGNNSRTTDVWSKVTCNCCFDEFSKLSDEQLKY